MIHSNITPSVEEDELHLVDLIKKKRWAVHSLPWLTLQWSVKGELVTQLDFPSFMFFSANLFATVTPE